MTQKEKLRRAFLFAVQVKAIANNLKLDAEDYDVKFPKSYATELETKAENLLKELR